jgi:hypothetical protein
MSGGRTNQTSSKWYWCFFDVARPYTSLITEISLLKLVAET